MSEIFLNEKQIRAVIRKRLIQETNTPTEVVKDLGTGVAAGIGTAATLGAMGVGTTAVAATGMSGAAAGVLGLGAANFWNPVGWGIIGAAAVGTALYFILDQTEGSEVVKQVLSHPGGTLVPEIEKTLKELESKLSAQGVETPEGGYKHQYIPDSEVDNYVNALYEATKGGFLNMGLGTDEEGIKKVFNEIPTLMDVAKVSKYFQEDHSDAWTFDPNLYNVMTEELSQSDFNKYVTRPLNPETKPVIMLGGKPFTLAELKEWNGAIEGIKGGDETGGDLLDPSSLKGNTVQKIQNVMNLYSERSELGLKISEDGKWGQKTDGLWEKYLNHVVVNHGIFKENAGLQTFKEGFHSWANVSEATVSTYPGYTSNMNGCLAFVVDGYNGNVDYGSGKKSISGGGGGGGGRKGGGNQKIGGGEVEEPITKSTGRATGLIPDVNVTLAGPGKDTLESVGFPSQTSTRLAKTISTRVKGTITGGTINLTVVVNRNGVVSAVRVAPGQRRNPINKQFENLRNVVRRFLEKAGNADLELINPSKVRKAVRAKSRKFELVLDFPSGTYN